jgi:exonuclease V gamma subunit
MADMTGHMMRTTEGDSLQYSSSSITPDSSLRPSVTIKRMADTDTLNHVKSQWKEIFGRSIKEIPTENYNPKKFSQLKLKLMNSDNLPFGDEIKGSTKGEKSLISQHKQHKRYRKLALNYDDNARTRDQHIWICGKTEH